MRNIMKPLLTTSALVFIGLALAGCEDPIDTEILDKTSCLSLYSADNCSKQYNDALKEHRRTAPVYINQELCEKTHGKEVDGKKTCEKREYWTVGDKPDGEVFASKESADKNAKEGQVVHHHSGTSPLLWYWLGQMSGNNSPAYSTRRPLYSSAGTKDLVTSAGTKFAGGVSKVGQAFKVKPSRVKPPSAKARPTVTRTASRGGFGGARGIGG